MSGALSPKTPNAYMLLQHPHFQRLATLGRTAQARTTQALQSAWLVFIVGVALAFTLSVARADEYTDVSQLMRSGKTTQAMAMVERHLASKPADPQMRFFKGLLQRDANQPDAAIATFLALTADYPELPEPHNNLAVLYASQNEFEKAREALEMAIRTNPNYSTAHENLGDVHARLASVAYQKALQLDAANTSAGPKLTLVRDLLSLSVKIPVVPPAAPLQAPSHVPQK